MTARMAVALVIGSATAMTLTAVALGWTDSVTVRVEITRGEWWEWLLYLSLTAPVMLHSILWWRRDRQERKP